MARSLCGVPGLTNGGSAHSRAGSETTEDQRSKQVTVASYTTPLEYYDGVYSMPYIDFQSPANQVAKDENQDNNGSEIIILSKRIVTFLEGRNAHLSDKNRSLIRQNQKRYAVMAEQPHHCHPRS
jgi:hypothetical protein